MLTSNEFAIFVKVKEIIKSKPSINWYKSREINDLIHVLKIQEDDSVTKLKNAKGLISMKTKIMIYLKEKVKTRLISPTLEKDLTIPAKENKSVAAGTQNNVVFNTFRNSEKVIVFWKSVSAVDIKNDVQKSIIKIICSQIHRLLFISTAKMIDFRMNSFGDSVLI